MSCSECEYFDNSSLKKMCAKHLTSASEIYGKIYNEYKDKGQEVPPHLEPDYNEGWR